MPDIMLGSLRPMGAFYKLRPSKLGRVSESPEATEEVTELGFIQTLFIGENFKKQE